MEIGKQGDRTGHVHMISGFLHHDLLSVNPWLVLVASYSRRTAFAINGLRKVIYPKIKFAGG